MSGGTFLTGGTVVVSSIERRELRPDTGPPMPFVVVELEDLLSGDGAGRLQIVMGVELAARLRVGGRFELVLEPAAPALLGLAQ